MHRPKLNRSALHDKGFGGGYAVSSDNIRYRRPPIQKIPKALTENVSFETKLRKTLAPSYSFTKSESSLSLVEKGIDSHLPLPLDDSFSNGFAVSPYKPKYRKQKPAKTNVLSDSESDSDDPFPDNNNGSRSKRGYKSSRSLTVNKIQSGTERLNAKDSVLYSSTPSSVLAEKKIQENKGIKSRRLESTQSSTFEELDTKTNQSFGRLSATQINDKCRLNAELGAMFNEITKVHPKENISNVEDDAACSLIPNTDESFDDIVQTSPQELFSRLRADVAGGDNQIYSDLQNEAEAEESERLRMDKELALQDTELMKMKKLDSKRDVNKERYSVLKGSLHRNWERKKRISLIKKKKRATADPEVLDEINHQVADPVSSSIEEQSSKDRFAQAPVDEFTVTEKIKRDSNRRSWGNMLTNVPSQIKNKLEIHRREKDGMLNADVEASQKLYKKLGVDFNGEKNESTTVFLETSSEISQHHRERVAEQVEARKILPFSEKLGSAPETLSRNKESKRHSADVEHNEREDFAYKSVDDLIDLVSSQKEKNGGENKKKEKKVRKWKEKHIQHKSTGSDFKKLLEDKLDEWSVSSHSGQASNNQSINEASRLPYITSSSAIACDSVSVPAADDNKRIRLHARRRGFRDRREEMRCLSGASKIQLIKQQIEEMNGFMMEPVRSRSIDKQTEVLTGTAPVNEIVAVVDTDVPPQFVNNEMKSKKEVDLINQDQNFESPVSTRVSEETDDKVENPRLVDEPDKRRKHAKIDRIRSRRLRKDLVADANFEGVETSEIEHVKALLSNKKASILVGSKKSRSFQIEGDKTNMSAVVDKKESVFRNKSAPSNGFFNDYSLYSDKGSNRDVPESKPKPKKSAIKSLENPFMNTEKDSLKNQSTTRDKILSERAFSNTIKGKSLFTADISEVEQASLLLENNQEDEDLHEVRYIFDPSKSDNDVGELLREISAQRLQHEKREKSLVLLNSFDEAPFEDKPEILIKPNNEVRTSERPPSDEKSAKLPFQKRIPLSKKNKTTGLEGCYLMLENLDSRDINTSYGRLFIQYDSRLPSRMNLNRNVTNLAYFNTDYSSIEDDHVLSLLVKKVEAYETETLASGLIFNQRNSQKPFYESLLKFIDLAKFYNCEVNFKKSCIKYGFEVYAYLAVSKQVIKYEFGDLLLINPSGVKAVVILPKEKKKVELKTEKELIEYGNEYGVVYLL